ncbi:MAG: hypothetical protein ABI835_20945 [Chloroflexota bacterium]
MRKQVQGAFYEENTADLAVLVLSSLSFPSSAYSLKKTLDLIEFMFYHQQGADHAFDTLALGIRILTEA